MTSPIAKVFPAARRLILTFGAAVLGAGVFLVLGLPAPWLTGPALAVTLASLAGARVHVPLALRRLCFLLIGVGIGTSVTPEVLATARTWPLSFAILGLAMIGTLISTMFALRRVFGFDARTAALCAPPGHLSFVLALAEDRGGDVRLVGLVQSTRVLFLTLILPPLLVPMVAPGGEGAADQTMRLWHWLALLPLSFALGQVFARLRLPAPELLAAMTLSSATQLTQITPGNLPDPITDAAFLTMGALIGTRFVGVTLDLVRRGLLAGVAVTSLAMVWALAAAWLGAQALGLPLAKLLVAYAPGGLEAMAAMAVILEIGPTFVAAHHVWRLMILTVLIPWLGPRE